MYANKCGSYRVLLLQLDSKTGKLNLAIQPLYYDGFQHEMKMQSINYKVGTYT